MKTAIKKTEKKSRAGSKKMRLEFFAPESKQVQVAGTFNDWKPEPLKKTKSGKWSISIDLQPGRYEYRFFVDGNWENDQRECECVPNNFGTWNCVLNVL